MDEIKMNETKMDEAKIDRAQGEIPENDSDARPSWSAYFGAATGLLLGVFLGMLGASIIDAYFPGTEYADVFWEISGPLFGILGFIAVGMAFHRWFGRQLRTPAVIFFAVFVSIVYLLYGQVDLKWIN